MSNEGKKTPWQKYLEENGLSEKPFENPDRGLISEETPVTINKGRNSRPWDIFNKNINRVSEEVANKRLSICEQCPRFKKSMGVCRECLCVMPIKVKLPNSYCPLGRWQAEDPIVKP